LVAPLAALVVTLAALVVPAEDRQQQEEHVEDVEEDRRG
jgi:hypothetical protein